MTTHTSDAQQERVRYAEFCLAYCTPGHEVLDAELCEVDRVINELRRELTVIGWQFKPRPHLWFGRWRGRTAGVREVMRDIAAEFDALLLSPYVESIDIVPQPRALLVQCAAPHESLRHLRLDLSNMELTIVPRLAGGRRRAVRALAPALIGAGDLVGLVALVMADASPPERGRRSAPRVAAGARDSYMTWRITRLRTAGCDSNPAQLDAEMRLEAAGQRLSLLMERAYEIEATIAAAKTHEPSHTFERYAQDYDSLRALPGIDSIAIDAARRTIQIRTTPIVLRANGRAYLIGRFLVEIAPGVGVTMHNLDGPRDPSGQGGATAAYDHPHIRRGEPCLGDAWRFFSTYLARGDFPAVIQQSLEFLGSFNSRSPYVSPTLWPAFTEPNSRATAESTGA